jgi:hypothetical protein
MALQSSFAVGDECFEEIRFCFVEETKVCTPRHVADNVDSSFPHLGCTHGYLLGFIPPQLINAGAIATDVAAEP